ncbi:MAG: hypothetical protein QXV58_15200 [Saccharolobus sp.]|uniref:hypothetical protein n=1 Tax=Saccharolobus sp. TaxID=2100761 RepID=UPI0031658C77
MVKKSDVVAGVTIAGLAGLGLYLYLSSKKVSAVSTPTPIPSTPITTYTPTYTIPVPTVTVPPIPSPTYTIPISFPSPTMPPIPSPTPTVPSPTITPIPTPTPTITPTPTPTLTPTPTPTPAQTYAVVTNVSTQQSATLNSYHPSANLGVGNIFTVEVYNAQPNSQYVINVTFTCSGTTNTYSVIRTLTTDSNGNGSLTFNLYPQCTPSFYSGVISGLGFVFYYPVPTYVEVTNMSLAPTPQSVVLDAGATNVSFSQGQQFDFIIQFGQPNSQYTISGTYSCNQQTYNVNQSVTTDSYGYALATVNLQCQPDSYYIGVYGPNLPSSGLHVYYS